jgi:hypothetical protein
MIQSMRAAAEATGVSYWKLYRACRAGKVAASRVGASLVFTDDQMKGVQNFFVTKEQRANRLLEQEPQGTGA